MRTILPKLLALAALSGCVDEQLSTQQSSTTPPDLANYLAEPIRPLPIPQENEEKVLLGKMLFYEAKLSGTGTISCASCHALHQGEIKPHAHLDNQHANTGLDAPSVLNAAHNFRQNWNGKALTLEDQIDDAMQGDAGKMHGNWDDVITKLKGMPKYVSQFRQAYNSDIDRQTIKDALTAFQTSLARPSRFDDFLRGDRDAISIDEKMGYLKFKEYGCTTCHQGVNVGGNMFQKLGIVRNYFKDRGHWKKIDLGKYNYTGKEEDKFVFKVPSLRNIALTAPYLHDGSIPDLASAIRLMGRYQLGKEIPDKDVKYIETFLKSLTGKTYEQASGQTTSMAMSITD